MNTVRYVSVLIFAMLMIPGCLSLEDIEPEVIKGCTDEVALNFDENANSNDGTCEYEPEETFEGCTSPSAANFDPEALINDGSCVFKASAPEIDSALRDISEALGAYRNGDEMDYPLKLSDTIGTYSLETFSDINGARMHYSINNGVVLSTMEIDGVATVCYIISDSDNNCVQYRNYADSTSLGENTMTVLQYYHPDPEEIQGVVVLYSLLLDLSIPAGTEWDVEIDSSMTYQTATTQLPGMAQSLTANLSMGSVSLISLNMIAAGIEIELSLSEDTPENVPEADDPWRIPVEIEWSDPVIENTGPVYIWSCMIAMVDLDSLDNEDVDSVNEAMYGSDMDMPDFCGELVANDPENGTFSSTGPIFDTRWGMVTYIYDPQTEGYKEVVAEIDNRPTSTVYYLLDVTADECSENEGTYDPITQTCEWMTQEINNTASDLYSCQEYPDWGEFCQRYGINDDGHLVNAWEVEDSSGGGGDSGESEMIWDCRDSFFAEDTTPLTSDDDEDVQAEVDAMTAPAWCGQIIEWNSSFESDPSSESAISNSNWNHPDSMYLDFTSAGALTVGDRSVTQSECNEYGGSWNAIEEACEFPNGEWMANETLIELDFGWGVVEIVRYELIDGGIVLAFADENGSGTGTPDMANTFYEGWDETGYQTYDFTASEDGLHIIDSAQDEDGYLYLYEGSFDSQNPLTNVLASQDDWEVGSDWGSSIHWDLVAGQDYVIVTTAYSSGYEMVFENSISSPSGDLAEWEGTIDSNSPIFLRPDGHWEDGGGGGSGGGESGMMMSVSVSEYQMAEVSLNELTIEIYTDEGEVIGSAAMGDALTEFDWGSVAIMDNDGNGLLSAGDDIVIQSDVHDENIWFYVWDDWAGDYAS